MATLKINALPWAKCTVLDAKKNQIKPARTTPFAADLPSKKTYYVKCAKGVTVKTKRVRLGKKTKYVRLIMGKGYEPIEPSKRPKAPKPYKGKTAKLSINAKPWGRCSIFDKRMKKEMAPPRTTPFVAELPAKRTYNVICRSGKMVKTKKVRLGKTRKNVTITIDKRSKPQKLPKGKTAKLSVNAYPWAKCSIFDTKMRQIRPPKTTPYIFELQAKKTYKVSCKKGSVVKTKKVRLGKTKKYVTLRFGKTPAPGYRDF